MAKWSEPKKTESSRALQGNCLSLSQQCLERLQPGNISHQNTHWFSRKRVTWSVWGVSVCPGPGWGWVWRSPEENDLGSASPGTPYRFAWQTDGGRGGGVGGVYHLSPTQPWQLVSFSFFFSLPHFYFFYTHPHHFGSTHVKMCPKKHLKKPAAESSMPTRRQKRNTCVTHHRIFSWCRVRAVCFFSISLCLLDLYQCWNHCCDDSTGREWQNLALCFCFVHDVVVQLSVCV